MKRLIVLICVLMFSSLVLADWDPGDGHKMHFPQLPDEDGWDVRTNFPVCLADDWLCTQTGFVDDIHFWGSWKDLNGDGHGDVGVILSFNIAIHQDLPVGHPDNPYPYSIPGEPLWIWSADDFGIRPIDPPTAEGWYDPDTGEVIPNDHAEYFQYNITNIPMPFWQQAGDIYWLDICANVEDEAPLQPMWGWKSTEDHWNDDAVWISQRPQPIWLDLYEPVAPITDFYWIVMNPGGVFGGGGGSGFADGEWFYYPDSQWWNQWFYDHPFDDQRKKVVTIKFDLFQVEPGIPAYIEFALNYSTPEWSDLGFGDTLPPTPDFDENLFIERVTLLQGDVVEGPYEFEYVIRDYNPEWVSIDVRGENFVIDNGIIIHDCVEQSLDLAFVITGDPPGSIINCDLSITPPYGTLPFSSLISVSLTNKSIYNRQFAGVMNIRLASGAYFPNWRAGYGNVGPGGSIGQSWNQSFPALPTLVGKNYCTLFGVDITPAPYNLPPYPPAGETCGSAAKVVCYAP